MSPSLISKPSYWSSQRAKSAPFFTAPYLPSLHRAIHSLQDADTCLLTSGHHEAASAAMGYHREVIAHLKRIFPEIVCPKSKN